LRSALYVALLFEYVVLLLEYAAVAPVLPEGAKDQEQDTYKQHDYYYGQIEKHRLGRMPLPILVDLIFEREHATALLAHLFVLQRYNISIRHIDRGKRRNDWLPYRTVRLRVF